MYDAPDDVKAASAVEGKLSTGETSGYWPLTTIAPKYSFYTIYYYYYYYYYYFIIIFRLLKCNVHHTPLHDEAFRTLHGA